MQLVHRFTVPATVEDAWHTFMDLERVGSCFPGASVTEVTEAGFSGTVKVKLGPIAMLYAGSGSFVERDDAARRAVVEAKGRDKRGNGTAAATVTIQLADEGGATTGVEVTTDLTITGKPAQFGRGVMQEVSDTLLQQFVGCIEGRFAPAGEGQAGAAGEPAPPPAQGPSAPVPGPVPVSEAAAPSGRPAAGGPAGPQDAQVDAAIPVDRSRPAPAAAGPAPAAAPAQALDLGRTVAPALLRAYGTRLAAAALALAALGWLVRRWRCRC